jgi:general secretion pathway protein C
MLMQRIIILVNLALLTLGAYFGAGLVYQIAGARSGMAQTGSEPQAPTPARREAAGKPLAAYTPIMQRDLFKTAKTPTPPPPTDRVKLEELEETQLKLKLWGTVSGLEKRSYAVIEDTQKREQDLYRVGDSVQGATVKAILRSRVVLSVNGKDEVLAMEQLVGGTAAKGPARRRKPPVGKTGRVRTQRVSLRRSMINNAIQDVSKLMTQIQITPNESGLAISNIKPNSIFRRMGLRNGDILKSVDGQEIRSVDDALKLYENLKSADNVSVSIMRRGADRNIDYMIR